MPELEDTMEPSKRNNLHGACRQRNKKSFAASCAAIGCASMLLAVSSVHAFSSIGRRTGVRPCLIRSEFAIPGSPKLPQANFLALCRKDSTVLLATGVHSDEAPKSTAATRHASRSSPRRSSTRRFSTRLNYRDGNEDESASALAAGDLQDKEAARWWQSVFQHAPSPTQEDEEQQVVDEYLEFLDKRYKRLHENERRKKKPEPAPKKFSALGWLAGDKSDPMSQQQEEDALYVLGVAELASERLLQKHHGHLQYKRRASTQEVEKKQEVIIDAVVEEEPTEDNVIAKDESSEARKALMFAAIAQSGRKLLKGISARRKALIEFQDKKIVAAAALALKTLLSTPIKAMKLFWNLGGGKKTIALTASAFITAFLVIRPVAEAVMRETTLSS